MPPPRSTQLTTLPAVVGPIRRRPSSRRSQPRRHRARSRRRARGHARVALPFIGREDDLAWLETRRAEARSLVGARASSATSASARRAWSASSSTWRRRRATWSCRRGPTPPGPRSATGRSSARSCSSPLCPRSGGASRDWVAATRRRGAGSADVFGHEPPDRAARALARRAPLRRGRGAAVGVRASERARARAPRRPRGGRPALRRRREPQRVRRHAQRSAARPGAAHRHVHARGSTPDGRRTSRRRASSPGCRTARWRRCVAQAVAPERPPR